MCLTSPGLDTDIHTTLASILEEIATALEDRVTGVSGGASRLVTDPVTGFPQPASLPVRPVGKLQVLQVVRELLMASASGEADVAQLGTRVRVIAEALAVVMEDGSSTLGPDPHRGTTNA